MKISSGCRDASLLVTKSRRIADERGQGYVETIFFPYLLILSPIFLENTSRMCFWGLVRLGLLLTLGIVVKSRVIDMNTNHYHTPDVLMPAVRQLVKKKLDTAAARYFNPTTYMEVRA